MSQVDNLLEGLSESEISAYTIDPEAEGHIVVDGDRNVTVPDALKRIAVQGDHNIETVTFDCPRYWDGVDMSTMRVYINYRLSNGSVGSYPADNVVVDENDDTMIHFDWVITKFVTQSKGFISFLVCIKNIDEEGNEQHQWNSELNSEMFVSEGLEADAVVIEQYPDIITHLLSRMEIAEDVARIDISEIEGGHRITVTSPHGVQTFNVLDRPSPTVEVVEIEDGVRQVTITDPNKDNPIATVFNIKDGEKGDKGDPGAATTVDITEIDGGVKVTIVASNGTHEFNVMDGTINDEDLDAYDEEIKTHIKDSMPLIITATIGDSFTATSTSNSDTEATINVTMADLLSAYNSKRPMVMVVSGGMDGAFDGLVLTNTKATLSSDKMNGSFEFRLNEHGRAYSLSCNIIIFEGVLMETRFYTSYKPTVTSEYKDGDWTVRKWSNGECELWGSAVATANISTQWGSVYVKADAIAAQSYPVTFASAPHVLWNQKSIGTMVYGMYLGGVAGTTTTTPSFSVWRGESATSVQVGVDIYVKGTMV